MFERGLVATLPALSVTPQRPFCFSKAVSISTLANKSFGGLWPHAGKTPSLTASMACFFCFYSPQAVQHDLAFPNMTSNNVTRRQFQSQQDQCAGRQRERKAFSATHYTPGNATWMVSVTGYVEGTLPSCRCIVTLGVSAMLMKSVSSISLERNLPRKENLSGSI
jgi:hypothetical protein